MMASARAVRDYTASDLGPLLQQSPQRQTRFLAETVPDFAAITIFDMMKQKYPEYAYREAGLNPTNPKHHAEDWEADVIGYLRDHRDQPEVTGERQTPTGPSLYLATPIPADPPCLQCHSEPEAAPASMIATYGTKHGFGWKRGSVVAAQIANAPYHRLPSTNRRPEPSPRSAYGLRWSRGRPGFLPRASAETETERGAG